MNIKLKLTIFHKHEKRMVEGILKLTHHKKNLSYLHHHRMGHSIITAA